MPFVVYVQDSETNKIVATGAFDKMPLIIAEDASSFVYIPQPFLDRTQFYKPAH